MKLIETGNPGEEKELDACVSDGAQYFIKVEGMAWLGRGMNYLVLRGWELKKLNDLIEGKG